MLNIIKRLIAFLLPIVGKAALQTAADVISDAAYPERRRMPRRTSYNHPPRGYTDLVDYSKKDVGETARLFEFKDSPEASFRDRDRYHDVIMVAFDITGPNQALVYEWLNNQMPATTNIDEEYYLDAWWIADDDAPGDCDSAVFVPKGDQEAARAVLRERGFTN